MVGWFIELMGKLGSEKVRLVPWNIVSVFIDGVVYLLFFSRRKRRRVISHMDNADMDLEYGHVRTFEIVGMGFKFETKYDGEFIVILAYSHHVEFDNSYGFVMRRKDKQIVIFSVRVQNVNDLGSKLKMIGKINKYKEKGIIDSQKPEPIRVRKEKKR